MAKPVRSEKLHLALVTMEYPPLFGGGIATYAYQTARLLGQAGHRVSVFTQARQGDVPPLENVTVHPVSQETIPSTGPYWLNWTAANCRLGADLTRQLAEVHEAESFDAIEVTDYYAEGLFLDVSHLVRDGAGRVPVVTHFHGSRSLVTGLNGASFDPLLTKLEEAALAGAEFRKASSPLMRDQVDQRWPGTPCEFVPAPFFAPERSASDGRASRDLCHDFLYFGRFEHRKGIEPFVKALKVVAARGREPNVCLVGGDTDTAPDGGSMAAWIERELRPALGARLDLRDAIPQAELWGLLAQARVLVIPSLWESLGFAALEGFCSGRPVLCSDKVGAAYVLEGSLAERTIVDVCETEEFANSLTQTLDMPEDDLTRWGIELQEAVSTALAPQTVLAKVVGYYERCGAAVSRPDDDAARRAAERRRWLSIVHMLGEQAAGELSQARQTAARQEAVIEELGGRSTELENAKRWLEEQWKNWQQIAEERETSIKELQDALAEGDASRRWLEEQRSRWEQIATERQDSIEKLKDTIDQLEAGKAWVEKQRANWEHASGQHEATIEKLQQALADAQAGKTWLEEQLGNWQALAEGRGAAIEDMQAGQAWLEEQRANWRQVAIEREKRLADLSDWLAELQQGKDWLDAKHRQHLSIIEQQERRIAELRERLDAMERAGD